MTQPGAETSLSGNRIARLQKSKFPGCITIATGLKKKKQTTHDDTM